ncbi:acyl-CoA thioesterase [bacterium]|nr:acyl-CoA thioesterase [bacterium]
MTVSPHRYLHRVRFRECDPMGVVYHAHFIDWFEYARTEALREIGLPYKEIQHSGTSLPVVDLAVKYHKSAYYDDLLVVETVPSLSASGLKLTCNYTVRRQEDDQILVTGHVTLCFLQEGRSRPVPAPKAIQEALLPKT